MSLLALFKLFSTRTLIPTIQVSPHFIDIENSVLRFLPERATEIQSSEVLALQSLLTCFSIKDLAIRGCSFIYEDMVGLYDSVSINQELTSVDFSD
ncbi:hypothetical protein GEMRC1_004981 [Eukaryota sp. GEM-RC1]